MYINAHTHHLSSSPEIKEVFVQDFHNFKQVNDLFILGIHPWQADTFNDEMLVELKKQLQVSNCIGLGEIGLDLVCKVPMEAQKKVFKVQLELVKERPTFPIIIHCVKTYSEIYSLIKTMPNPIVWHDFNGNKEVTRTLNSINSYYSLGVNFMRNKAKVHDAIEDIALDRILFETDDSQLDIHQVYQTFSKIKGIAIEELKQQVARNFSQIFSA